MVVASVVYDSVEMVVGRIETAVAVRCGVLEASEPTIAAKGAQCISVYN